MSSKRLTILLVSLLTAISYAADAPVLHLTVLQTTDLHGFILENEESPGILKLASVIRREYVPEKTLLIDCGDTFEGSFEAAVTKGQIMIPVMNSLPVDAWIPGNHDFDWGARRFLELASQLKCARVAANLEIYSRPPEGVAAWRVFEKAGLKIALVGMTSPHLDKWLWGAQAKGIEVRGFAASLEKIMPEIIRARPDMIILAVHGGMFAPERLDAEDGSLADIARAHPEIDLILGGHTHQEEPGGRLGQTRVWFVQGGQHAEAFAKVDIAFDKKKGRIVSLESRILRADADEKLDQAMRAAVEKPLADAAAAGAKSVGRLSSKLGPERKRGGARNSLADFICEAIAEATGAKIAFHGGSGASSLGPGMISEMQLYRAMPYENRVGTLELTPSQCRAIIEEQGSVKDKARRLAAWGLEFKLDAYGCVEGPLKLAGGALWTDENARMKAAFSGYDLASGGGRFPILARIASEPSSKATDAGMSVRDAMRLAIAKNATDI